jgi:uncharacterized membrane protein
MNKSRVEAFSDGVIAIIITIMVLELKVPAGTSLNDLVPILPVLFSYMLSFVFIGIYWGNHHHLLHTVTHVGSGIIWSNLNLLFWLSLIPFATAWMGENHFAPNTIAVYALLLNLCGLSYYILQQVIIKKHQFNAVIMDAMKKQSRKGALSVAGYFLAIPLAYVHASLSEAIFMMVAILWIIPDKNIEKAIQEH